MSANQSAVQARDGRGGLHAQSYTQEQLDGMDTEELLRLYRSTGQEELKWAVVLRCVGFIKSIVCQISGVYNSFAQLDDMVSEGIIALESAVDRFDPEAGTKFETFVSQRIRGMVIDLARREDWIPRSVRKRLREINQAVGELYNTLGRYPSDLEVAAKLGITQAQYQEEQNKLALCNLISLESVLESREEGRPGAVLSAGDDDETRPERALEARELHEVLRQGICSLRETEQMVLSLYYEKNLKMKEIAQVMGVSAPRVSQIHSKAVQKLRLYLEKYTKSEPA